MRALRLLAVLMCVHALASATAFDVDKDEKEEKTKEDKEDNDDEKEDNKDNKEDLDDDELDQFNAYYYQLSSIDNKLIQHLDILDQFCTVNSRTATTIRKLFDKKYSETPLIAKMANEAVNKLEEKLVEHCSDEEHRKKFVSLAGKANKYNGQLKNVSRWLISVFEYIDNTTIDNSLKNMYMCCAIQKARRDIVVPFKNNATKNFVAELFDAEFDFAKQFCDVSEYNCRTIIKFPKVGPPKGTSVLAAAIKLIADISDDADR